MATQKKEKPAEPSGKGRTAFTLRKTTLRDLAALSFALNDSQTSLVEHGVSLILSTLSKAEQTAFDAARAAQEKRVLRAS